MIQQRSDGVRMQRARIKLLQATRQSRQQPLYVRIIEEVKGLFGKVTGKVKRFIPGTKR